MAKKQIGSEKNQNSYHQEHSHLLKNMECFRTIFETAQDPIFLKDTNLDYILINPAMANLFGVSCDEFVGSIDEQIFDEKTQKRVMETDLQVLGGKIIEEEYTLTINEKEKTFHVVKVPLHDDSRTIIGLCGIARDITERNNAEKSLRELEAKYRSVVENVNEGIAVIQDEVIKYVNPKTLDYLGISKSDLTSKPFADFVHPDDRDMVLDNHIRRMKREEFSPQYEFRIIGNDGKIKWIQINSVLIDWEGKPAVLNFLDDITGKKNTEEEMLRADKLESLGTLAGGIAHDFNNILTAILGNISLVKMYTSQGDKLYERLIEAEKASLRAKELTQQLQIFSKGGSPVFRTTSIVRLLRDSVNFGLSGSNVKCDFLVSDDLHLVDIDESQISHAINNIVINAVQAMSDGGTIRIRAENTLFKERDHSILKHGKYVKISIEDEGIGIPKEDLLKVFDPYFTTKGKAKGLGLTSAYSIAKKHNGHINVESELGVGTIFNIYIPASENQHKIENKVSESNNITGKVLVMDDEEAIRNLVSEALSRIGYEINTACDGTKALELYLEAINSKNPYDMIILDLTIPGGMGGEETIKKLIEIDPNVRAIVSSGYLDNPVIANFREYGFKGFIVKPYRIDDLKEVLGKIMAQ